MLKAFLSGELADLIGGECDEKSILVKNFSASAEWEIYDNKRAGYNPANYHLNAHDNSVEATLDNRFDLLSNGWKIKAGPSGPINTSGNTYIYMAFAEEPLVGDNPATAR